jgi:hypothetical protein
MSHYYVTLWFISKKEQTMDGLTVVCGSTFFFGTLLLIIFGFFGYLRYLRYKETLALAEKGLVLPQHAVNGKGALRWGISLTALGIALCLGLYPVGWIAARGEFPLNFGPWMLLGLLPTFFGLGLVLIYALTAREHRETEPSNGDLSLENLDETPPVE